MSDAYRVKPSEIRALSPAGRSSLAAWIARVDRAMPGDSVGMPKPCEPRALTTADAPARGTLVRWEGGEAFVRHDADLGAFMRKLAGPAKAAPPVEPVQIVTTIASAPPAVPAPVDLLALFWQTCAEGRA